MTPLRDWISAFRLRTLPLALSSILAGSFLAVRVEKFQWSVFILAGLTTIFLQVLSNLANDFGDSDHGVDNAQRVGPARAVQQGTISSSAMKRAVILFAVLSFASGIWLLWDALGTFDSKLLLLFLAVGLLAIGAAIKYTMGAKPYGYAGLGDLSVFLFFGVVGVIGTYFLHTLEFSNGLVFPVVIFGFLSAGVLNLNNLRDKVNDANSGKNTLVVRLGVKGAQIYHTGLLIGALTAGIAYTLSYYHSPWQWLFLVVIPLLGINLKAVWTFKQHKDLDPQLKKLALTTLLFALTFGLGLII